MKIFIDFDETLFNHYTYIDWADAFLAKFDVAPGGYKGTVDSFHEHMGEKLRLYKHEDHIEAASGKAWSFISGELDRALKQGDHDFCYEDTHQFLRTVVKNEDVRILTYGNGEYQRYKMNICPVLSELRIPVHIVSQPKREFLKTYFNNEPGVLIDDKFPLHIEKPWSHIWINRISQKNELVLHPEENTVELNTLAQFERALKKLSHI